MKANKTKKVKTNRLTTVSTGIRTNNKGSYYVERMIDGYRYYGTFTNLNKAKAYYKNLR